MDLTILAIIFLAIGLGAFAKGLTGLGLPLISIPIIAGFLGVEHAVVVMTIPVFVSNVWIVWSYRRRATAIPGLVPALFASVLGTAAGTFVLAVLDERALVMVLAVWIAAYLVNLAVNPDFRFEGRTARIASPLLAAFAGLSQGATGISGPVIATWIHTYRLHKEAYVFGVSVMFLMISGTHVLMVSAAGLMDQTRLLQGLMAVVPTMLLVPLGMRTTRLVSTRAFNRLIITIVVVMEAKLIWQGVIAG
jgi:uncharacterized protein